MTRRPSARVPRRLGLVWGQSLLVSIRSRALAGGANRGPDARTSGPSRKGVRTQSKHRRIARAPWDEIVSYAGALEDIVRVAPGVVIAIDDPGAIDVRAVLEAHLAFSRRATPARYSFALDAAQLTGADVTFFSARENGEVVGVAAVKRLDGDHAELKSMHVRESSRGRGVGRAMMTHLLDLARTSGYRRMSLETGSTDDFAAARALYTSCRFVPCGAFGGYEPSPYNTFMTISLDPEPN